MAQIDKNTVSAENQLQESEYVRFFGNPTGELRVLFVGNSITRHGINESIGWHLDCGMAASSPEKDYVHLVAAEVLKKRPDAGFCLCQVAEWERKYKTGDTTFPLYENARRFEADVIIMRLIENCPHDAYEPPVFRREYQKLIDFFSPTGKASVILTTGFWHHAGDAVIRKLAAEYGYPIADLGHYGEDDAMKAIGLFEHTGVANHPGDLGMQKIAQEILAILSNII